LNGEGLVFNVCYKLQRGQ